MQTGNRISVGGSGRSQHRKNPPVSWSGFSWPSVRNSGKYLLQSYGRSGPCGM